ncbi:MAG TPA: HAD family hydrolase [Thermoplasmata archaeon]
MNPPFPKGIKAVIFDLDDTLVESTVNYGKFKRLVIDRITDRGEDGSEYRMDETIVVILSRYEKAMKGKGLSKGEIASRLAELDRIMDEVELESVDETVAIRGAAEVLDHLRRNGVKVGILTRGCHEYATAALRATSMLDMVDALECRNSDTKAKPDPESYLKLVSQLGVGKDETLFVGDHPIDAQCASNATVPFVGVLSGDVPEEVLRRSGSMAVFRDVGEMLDWIRSGLNS